MKLWDWPDGLVWKLTRGITERSRKKKYDLFYTLIKPNPADTILDVGVNPHVGRSMNFLELWYPYLDKITAVTAHGEEMFVNFRKAFPEVKLVFGDGRRLDFKDDQFDIVFSNAVVEHVGNEEQQRQFIHELVRVGRRAFITTPNYFFPVDAHTLLPFAHWLPERPRFFIYRKARREYWADINHLNLLTPSGFLSLFPKGVNVRIVYQRLMGLPVSMIAVVTK
ncbi:MAG: methyltransferase domain-containing protein [Candidatus Omnitrophota bacterium]